MKNTVKKSTFWMFVLFFACVLGSNVAASAQTKSSSTATVQQTGFATPDAAATALVDAAEKFDVPLLSAILGPGSEDLIASGDPVKDKGNMNHFAEWAREKMSVDVSPNKKQATLLVGKGQWPMPIPIVNRNGKWYFDTKQGRHEILARRIGENELDAIAICRGYVEAQQQYASQVHDDSGVNQYAQKMISSPGKRDGLDWENSDGTEGGPISKLIAKALSEGYSKSTEPAPFHGYYFKMLKGRGLSAPGGKLDFVIEGVMIGGFGLAAAPAQYGITGIKTFIVSYEGIVYQKDLGPDSLKVFSQIDTYNPDKTWTRTDDNWPPDALASDDQ